jgi:hypothetical protein
VQAIAEMIGMAGLGRDDFFIGMRLRINDKAKATLWYAAKLGRRLKSTVAVPHPPTA